MTFVVSFRAFSPAPRFDGIPFEGVRYEEAVNYSAGPWAGLETQLLVPIDADPSEPLLRNLTTTQALLEAGWYRLAWIDAAGHEEVSDPVGRSGAGLMLPPAEDDIRERSFLLQQLYPEDPPTAAVEWRLREVVRDAVAIIESLTGRRLDPTLPEGLVRIAVRAVTLKTERMGLATASAKVRRKAISGTRLRSFTAGPYSESYFGPEEASRAKMLDPDPDLNELLWALTTEAKREEWMILWGLKSYAPAFAVQSFDYRRTRGRY